MYGNPTNLCNLGIIGNFYLYSICTVLTSKLHQFINFLNIAYFVVVLTESLFDNSSVHNCTSMSVFCRGFHLPFVLLIVFFCFGSLYLWLVWECPFLSPLHLRGMYECVLFLYQLHQKYPPINRLQFRLWCYVSLFATK